MKEKKTDLFATVQDFADAICITTNGEYDDDDEWAYMGGGCAGVCSRRWPQTAYNLGKKLKEDGNIPHIIGFLNNNMQLVDGNEEALIEAGNCAIISFPTIDNLLEGSSIDLIEKSALELVKMADKYGLKNIVLPRPGVGIGGLSWKDVKPVIEPLLDDRFTIVSFAHEE